MYIIEDSRQQKEKHAIKHDCWEAAGDSLVRCKLPVGDYALPPTVAVDTKASMAEIAQNIGGTKEEHERFRNELKLAQAIGTQLYVLIENTDGIRCLDEVEFWQNPRLVVSDRAITGTRLAKAMRTMEARYGVRFLFCRPSDSAKIIKILLQKEQKTDD